MNREIMNIDFSQCSPAELSTMKDRILQVELLQIQKHLEKNSNDIAKVTIKNTEQRKALNAIDGRLAEQEKLTNVIGFSVHSKKFKNFRAACVGRIYHLLENSDSIYFSLWSPFLFKKIYGEIASHFEVDSCKNIHVDNYKEALALAKNWHPSDNYILEKTLELIKKRDLGQLRQERIVALSVFLNQTDNGRKNPFR